MACQRRSNLISWSQTLFKVPALDIFRWKEELNGPRPLRHRTAKKRQSNSSLTRSIITFVQLAINFAAYYKFNLCGVEEVADNIRVLHQVRVYPSKQEMKKRGGIVLQDWQQDLAW